MEDEKIDQFCKVAACLLVTAQALDIWNTKTSQMAHRLGQCYKHEIKHSLNGIEKACKAISFHMQTLTEWGINAAVTEDGHNQDMQAYDSMQSDAGWVAALTGYTFNASRENPNALTVVEAYCKSQTKEPAIKYEIIDSLKPII